METPLGQFALHEVLELPVPAPAVRSYAIAGNRRTFQDGARILEYYPRSYLGDTSPIGHLRFALRYEPLDLGVLAATFKALGPQLLGEWVMREPTGAYSRRAWFLYEYLTGRALDLPPARAGNYVEVLDATRHVVAARRNSPRHRVVDNLLGVAGLCPTVRRTRAIEAHLASDLAAEARQLTESCPPEVLARAVSYLYSKETRSSFMLEGEAPGASRTERFVAALRDASRFEPDSKAALIALQHAIVDRRYAAVDWRTVQNFVGGVTSGYREEVDFVCPRPDDVPALMAAWMTMVRRLQEAAVDPVVAASLAAFAFVFIHPFEDGNGRIHRFLLHHMLARRGFSPPGVIFPVSAAMLRERHRYDAALASFSRPILPFIEWRFDESNALVVANDTRDLYRFFDATPIVEYTLACVRDTINRDLKEELGFMALYDRAMSAACDIVDMPDRRASLLVRLILQNGGRLSTTKRSQFSEVTDPELAAIEAAVGRVSEAAD